MHVHVQAASDGISPGQDLPSPFASPSRQNTEESQLAAQEGLNQQQPERQGLSHIRGLRDGSTRLEPLEPDIASPTRIYVGDRNTDAQGRLLGRVSSGIAVDISTAPVSGRRVRPGDQWTMHSDIWNLEYCMLLKPLAPGQPVLC